MSKATYVDDVNKAVAFGQFVIVVAVFRLSSLSLSMPCNDYKHFAMFIFQMFGLPLVFLSDYECKLVCYVCAVCAVCMRHKRIISNNPIFFVLSSFRHVYINLIIKWVERLWFSEFLHIFHCNVFLLLLVLSFVCLFCVLLLLPALILFECVLR